MTNTRLPRFALEALADESLDDESAREVAEVLGDLVGTLPRTDPSPRGRGRLLEAVSQRPLRWAPLFDRLAGLLHRPVNDVEAMLKAAGDEGQWQDLPVDGVRVLPLEGGPEFEGGHCALVRMEAGSVFPEHHHVGTETALCLEGAFIDSREGRVYGAGDEERLEPGDVHSLRVTDDGECVLAVCVTRGGIEMKNPAD